MNTNRPRWRLPSCVYATAVEEDLVLLNTAADAYFCLPGGGGDLGLQCGSARVEVSNTSLAEALLAAGLLEAAGSDDGELRAIPPALPTRSLLSVRTPPPRLRDAGSVIASLADLLTTYRGKSLVSILERVSGGGEQPSASQPATSLDEVVQRFHRWSPYAPVSGKCLLRSYMLLRFLRRAGHDARWVFGVATWPFTAHCWLQIDDMVLDDAADRIAHFHPILVV
jgi:hypothetical protein